MTLHLISVIGRYKQLGLPLAVACLVAAAAGCASTPKSPEPGLTKEQILEQPDVKENKPTVFAQPVEKVREAGLRSLTFVGCKVDKQEPYFLKGSRPHKMGLFVGSGGEKVEIFLYPKAANETQVWVDTDLTFVGMAGQQGWNKQVLEEMQHILSQPPAAQ